MTEDLAALRRALRLSLALNAAALLAAGVAIVLALRAGGVPDDLRVRSLTVVDARGAEQARLATSGDGARLHLHATQARTEVMVGALGDAAGMAVRGEQDRVLLYLSAGSEEPATLSLADPLGRTRLLAGITDRREAVLSVRAADESSKAVLAPGGLRLLDRQGKDIAHAP